MIIRVPEGPWTDATRRRIEQLLRQVRETTNYTVATVPDATLNEGRAIYVSNEAGGAVIAFSDGTNWRRCTDRAVIS